ncbi:unnamed protein product [Symbiodinium sp. KB8]|nr:unnamed protein product [Symbiodinium sp. KB8]
MLGLYRVFIEFEEGVTGFRRHELLVDKKHSARSFQVAAPGPEEAMSILGGPLLEDADIEDLLKKYPRFKGALPPEAKLWTEYELETYLASNGQRKPSDLAKDGKDSGRGPVNCELLTKTRYRRIGCWWVGPAAKEDSAIVGAGARFVRLAIPGGWSQLVSMVALPGPIFAAPVVDIAEDDEPTMYPRWWTGAHAAEAYDKELALLKPVDAGDFVYEVYEKAGDRQCCLVNLDLLQVLDWPTDSRDGFVWLLRHTQHLCCELRKWRRRSKQKQGRLRDVEGARQRARVRKVRLKQVHKQLGFKQLPAVKTGKAEGGASHCRVHCLLPPQAAALELLQPAVHRVVQPCTASARGSHAAGGACDVGVEMLFMYTYLQVDGHGPGLKSFKEGVLDLAMVGEGDLAFAVLRSSDGKGAKICGWVVEASGDAAVIGTNIKFLEGVDGEISRGKGGHSSLGFVRIPITGLSASAPSSWDGPRARQAPSASACEEAWAVAEKNIGSSGAEAPREERRRGKHGTRASASLEKGFAGLASMFTAPGSDSEESEDEDDGEQARSSREFLPPGMSSAKGEKPKTDRAKPKTTMDPQDLLAAGVASGQSAQELMPLVMMSYLLSEKGKKSKKGRKRRDEGPLGGSSSDDSEDDEDFGKKGLKAVNALHRLNKRIQDNPRKIYMDFEREIIEELGVVGGQPRSVRDYLRRQPWGKFRGIQRCAVQDAAAYELLRSGKTEAAKAQLVQNMKSKIQMVLQQGDWSSAWLLTGLPDPLTKREFGGSKEELAVVSGYIDALAKLRKRVKETSANNLADEDEEAGGHHRK